MSQLFLRTSNGQEIPLSMKLDKLDADEIIVLHLCTHMKADDQRDVEREYSERFGHKVVVVDARVNRIYTVKGNANSVMICGNCPHGKGGCV